MRPCTIGAVVGALLGLACAGPTQLVEADEGVRLAVPPPPPSPPPSPPPTDRFEQARRRALAEIGVLREEHPLEVQEEAALHLVLDAGRCHRVALVFHGEVSAVLADDNGHELATGSGRLIQLGPLCPRWSGSFVLTVRASGSSGQAAGPGGGVVLLGVAEEAAEDPPRGAP